MVDLKDRITELAQLMDQFGLDQARLSDECGTVVFSRRAVGTRSDVPVAEPGVRQPAVRVGRRPKPQEPLPAATIGIPVTSPMMGIYYTSPSPGSPDFVKEGDLVTVGQVIGLIEAMKVFNEITATTSGTVSRVIATNGQLVQPGDPLLTIA